MKNLKSILLTLSMVLAVAISAFAGKPLNSFQGKYVNVDKNTRGITKIHLSISGKTVKVRTFGSCSPKDCDWGSAKGLPFAATVSQNVLSNTEVIQAIYKKGHATTYLNISPGRSGLTVRSMTVFTDGSNRTPYTSVAHFKKASVRPTIKRPATPVPTSRCGKTYNHFPRKMVLSWKKAQGAVKYFVEVDCYHCCKSGKWCSEVGGKYKTFTTASLSQAFNFVGAQPGRWRVTAINSRGIKSAPSRWCNFKFSK